MAQVDISVNGRSYTLTCEAGEEEHLRELAAHVDRKLTTLSKSFGQIGDTRLLLMAALLTTEEYLAAAERLDAQAKEIIALARSDEIAADAVEGAAKQVEGIAARLAAA